MGCSGGVGAMGVGRGGVGAWRMDWRLGGVMWGDQAGGGGGDWLVVGWFVGVVEGGMCSGGRGFGGGRMCWGREGGGWLGAWVRGGSCGVGGGGWGLVGNGGCLALLGGFVEVSVQVAVERNG
ncbi:hypothetical protein Tco_0905653 [Tanacetum coccineum]